MSNAPDPARAQSDHAGYWLMPLAVLLVSALFYSINLDDGIGLHDEYYHMLAARGMLETGEPRIADGLYTRGAIFTWIVSQSIGFFGDTLGTARLPSVLFVALCTALLFVWLRREAGPRSAWIGTSLFAISPFAVLTAQFVRFYSLQSLAFFIFCWLIYEAVIRARSVRGRVLPVLASLPFLWLAGTLQPTTFLGLVAVLIWVGAVLALSWLKRDDVSFSTKRNIIFLLIGLALVGLAGFWASGLFLEAWQAYRQAPFFNNLERNDFWYYHIWYSLFYPSLWPAIGLLSLIAFAKRPHFASFAITVFAVSFILNSLAGSKEMRYIAYAQPFMFVILGIAFASIASGLGRFFQQLSEHIAEHLPLSPVLAKRSSAGVLGFSLLLIVLANPFWLRTTTLLADLTVPGEKPDTRMPLAKEMLAPLMEKAGIVIVAEELQFLYYFGHYDVQFSPTKYVELPEDRRHPFGLDIRTGKPLIEDLASLNLLMDCYSSGLVAAPERRWNDRSNITIDATELIAKRAEVLELPKKSHVLAYIWEKPAGFKPPAKCAALEQFSLPPLTSSP